MGYGTNGLTFRTLRAANMQRLPLFKDAKGRTCHTEGDGSDWSPAQWLQAVVAGRRCLATEPANWMASSMRPSRVEQKETR
jgi:hypothetical protein